MYMSDILKELFGRPSRTLERRLHRRATLYWQSLGGGRRLVGLAEFDPSRIEDDLSHGFLLDLRNLHQPLFSYIGPVLEQEAGLEGKHIDFAAVPSASLLMRFASHYARVLESGQPETAEYGFMTAAGYHVLCRGALLPISSDGEVIDHVYGAVSWKSEKAQ